MRSPWSFRAKKTMTDPLCAYAALCSCAMVYSGPRAYYIHLPKVQNIFVVVIAFILLHCRDIRRDHLARLYLMYGVPLVPRFWKKKKKSASKKSYYYIVEIKKRRARVRGWSIHSRKKKKMLMDGLYKRIFFFL